ncbi:HAD family hydrolase [Candidatus Tisiphia endosymbiont of Temnostethus pusillus]|uniref:HAD family hydrolase n=1 Tax=Candidatus Tisiphia endosymbiont of Temnostethus pusillus TaxID=3139335 RepID=UPI0035C921A9
MSKLKQARLSLPPLDFSTPKDKQILNTPNSDQLKVKQQKDFLEKETQSDKMLLCFDWDKTIVKGSLDNALNATLNYQDCVDRFLADETKNWKNKELLVELFQKALTIGCHIAIVSFGSYPDWIKYALEQLLGSTLSKEIYVVSHPRRNDYEGKQEHIEEAKRHFGVSENKKVVLIDDDPNNVDIAKKNGMNGIYVPKEGIEYLNEAFEIVTTQEQKENQIQTSFDQPTEPTESVLEELLGEEASLINFYYLL